MSTVEELNASLKAAVKARMEGTPADDPKRIGYDIDGDDAESCCDGGQCHTRPLGHGVMRAVVHPTSQKFFDLCERLKEMHASKSSDYGCPSGNDPLANIRNGAAFVGIEPWKGAMVRLSDKVTRLATFNATGRLGHEGVVDTCLDLASYSLLALLLYEEEYHARAAD